MNIRPDIGVVSGTIFFQITSDGFLGFMSKTATKALQNQTKPLLGHLRVFFHPVKYASDIMCAGANLSLALANYYNFSTQSTKRVQTSNILFFVPVPVIFNFCFSQN